MKKTHSALFALVTALVFIPSFANAQAPWPTTAAIGTNTINNGNFQQSWQWNTITNNPGLFLNSNGTTTTDNNYFVGVAVSGVNSTSNVRSYALYVSNAHSGTGSTDYGLLATASGGTTNNYGILGDIDGPNNGDVGVWGRVSTGNAISYGVEGTNVSSAGYAGYFNNTGGGYAAAFMGGKVGIGTATPRSLVHAYGGEVQVGSSGASCATATNGAIRFSGTTLYYCTGTTWTSLAAGGSGTVTSSTAGQVAYYQSTGTTVIGTSTLNISGGKVGIGTTNPVGPLHVSGVSSGVYFTNPDFVNASAGSGLYLATGASSGNTYTELQAFQAGNTTVASLILQSGSGNVGISNTSPSFTLQVNGSVAGTSAYVNTSDARYKKNVKPLASGLSEIVQLKPVSFEWNDDVLLSKKGSSSKVGSGKSGKPRAFDPGMQGEQMGFVAQDVEKILPSVVVTEDNAEQTKGMKYSELIPVLVKAVQEQQAEISALKSKFGMQ